MAREADLFALSDFLTLPILVSENSSSPPSKSLGTSLVSLSASSKILLGPSPPPIACRRLRRRYNVHASPFGRRACGVAHQLLQNFVELSIGESWSRQHLNNVAVVLGSDPP